MRRYHNSSTGRFLSRRAIVDLTISGYLDKEECIPEDGDFDEPKYMCGFPDMETARYRVI